MHASRLLRLDCQRVLIILWLGTEPCRRDSSRPLVKLQVLSDLHLEFCGGMPRRCAVPPVVGDVLVLAGDIGEGSAALEAFAHADVPVVFVHGNHEPFGAQLGVAQQQLREAAARLGFHYLDNAEVVIGGVRFLGTTLWTDFEMYGHASGPAKALASRVIGDFSRIELGPGDPFSVQDSIDLHLRARRWLRARLAAPFQGRTVVVTHHAPSASSVPTQFEGDILSPAFASELHELKGLADLWVHGHMHSSLDYRWGKTRVVCNPRGYPRQVDGSATPQFENTEFDPAFIIDVDSLAGNCDALSREA